MCTGNIFRDRSVLSMKCQCPLFRLATGCLNSDQFKYHVLFSDDTVSYFFVCFSGIIFLLYLFYPWCINTLCDCQIYLRMVLSPPPISFSLCVCLTVFVYASDSILVFFTLFKMIPSHDFLSISEKIVRTTYISFQASPFTCYSPFQLFPSEVYNA